MAAAPALPLLLGLLAAQLCGSDAAGTAYSRLSEALKGGVDLALEKLHSHASIQHHFVFLRSVSQSDIQPGFSVAYIYHHFYLRATTCPRGTSDTTGCQLRNDRPLMDCAVCYKTLSDQIEPEPRPYVHCVHKTALTQEMKQARVQHCNQVGYSSGAPTLLASTANE